MKKYLFIITGVAFLAVCFSCKDKGNDDINTAIEHHKEAMSIYYDTQNKELEKDIKRDSIFFGVHFKMTSAKFFEHCHGMLKKGIFNGNYNNEVIVELDKGFKKKVRLVFYPKFDQPFIQSLRARFSYKNSSVFNRKDEGSTVLLAELKKVMIDWYGGNPFIEIPPKNAFERPTYVKIDGNREITLREDASLKEVIAIYTDLKPLF